MPYITPVLLVVITTSVVTSWIENHRTTQKKGMKGLHL